MGIFKKLFGTTSEKEVRALEPIVKKIEALEESYKALTDAELQAKTPEFKERLKNGETLDDILPEAFATGGSRPGGGATALPGPVDRRHHSPSGPDRRDEDR